MKNLALLLFIADHEAGTLPGHCDNGCATRKLVEDGIYRLEDGKEGQDGEGGGTPVDKAVKNCGQIEFHGRKWREFGRTLKSVGGRRWPTMSRRRRK